MVKCESLWNGQYARRTCCAGAVSSLQIPNLQELPAVAGKQKAFTNSNPLFLLARERGTAWNMT